MSTFIERLRLYLYEDAELKRLFKELDEAHNKRNAIHFKLQMAWNTLKDAQKVNYAEIDKLEAEKQRCYDIEQAYYWQSMACHEFKNWKASVRYSADAKKMKVRQSIANDSMHALIRLNKLLPEAKEYEEVLDEFRIAQLAVDEAQARYDTRLCELRIKADSA